MDDPLPLDGVHYAQNGQAAYYSQPFSGQYMTYQQAQYLTQTNPYVMPSQPLQAAFPVLQPSGGQPYNNYNFQQPAGNSVAPGSFLQQGGPAPSATSSASTFVPSFVGVSGIVRREEEKSTEAGR